MIGLPVGVSEWRDDMCRAIAARRGIEFLADPFKPSAESTYGSDKDSKYPFTVGFACGMIGTLLDALGYPEHGPEVDQRSWLPEADDDLAVAS